jgi:hypothetical protein
MKITVSIGDLQPNMGSKLYWGPSILHFLEDSFWQRWRLHSVCKQICPEIKTENCLHKSPVSYAETTRSPISRRLHSIMKYKKFLRKISFIMCKKTFRFATTVSKQSCRSVQWVVSHIQNMSIYDSKYSPGLLRKWCLKWAIPLSTSYHIFINNCPAQ